MNSSVLTVLLNAAVVAVIGWVLWSKVNGRRQASTDLGRLAELLGLAPVAGPPHGGATPETQAALDGSLLGRAGTAAIEALPGAHRPTFDGRIGGVRVAISLVAERRGQSGNALLTELLARPEVPWRLGLGLARQHAMDQLLQPGRQALDIPVGDPEFDRDVFVRAEERAPVLAMLQDVALRRQLRDYLVAHPRAWIDDDGVHLQLSGTASDVGKVRANFDTMVSLTRALERAVDDAGKP